MWLSTVVVDMFRMVIVTLIVSLVVIDAFALVVFDTRVKRMVRPAFGGVCPHTASRDFTTSTAATNTGTLLFVWQLAWPEITTNSKFKVVSKLASSAASLSSCASSVEAAQVSDS